MNKKDFTKTRRLTLAALLAAAALIIFIVEAQIPPLTPIPGVKPGLSNIVTVFALFSLGPGFALGVLIVRILLGALATGQVMALIYSLAGGLLAFALSCALRPLFPVSKIWVVSTLAALAHNIGQLAAAMLVTGTPEIVAYLPVLLISGVVTGAFTGLCAQALLKRLSKAGLVPIYKK